MTLQPEVQVVREEREQEGRTPIRADSLSVSVPEFVLVIAGELGRDPQELVRDAVAELNCRTGSQHADSGTRIAAELLWRAYDNRVPMNIELTDLEELVDLMRD